MSEGPVVVEMETRHAAEVDRLLKDAFGRDDEARLLRALIESGDLARAFVVEAGSRDEHDGDEVAGIAALCHLRAPEDALGLGPIAVDESHRHTGIGPALIGAAVAWAREQDAAAVFVLGRPRYYARFGFAVERASGFDHPYPKEFMMALELSEGRLEAEGELRYPPAFAAIG